MANSITNTEKKLQFLSQQQQMSKLLNWVRKKTEFDAKPTDYSPEISPFSPSSKKPPVYPTSESPSIRRRSSSKKSRFGEPSIPLDSQTLEGLGGSPRFSFNDKSPRAVSGEEAKEKEKRKEGPDEKEIYKRVTAQLSAKRKWRMTIKLVFEMLSLLSILSCLICSLTVNGVKGRVVFGIEVWKCFALLLVTFSGMLVSRWVVHCIVFLIEWKFLLKKNVVYFTHGLQTNVVVFLWIGVVLVTWIILFKNEAENVAKVTLRTKRILDYITWSIVTLLIGSFLWLVKTTLIKILASSFHLNRFFDRIQEAVFHHYVLQTLSGRPVVELARQVSRQESQDTQVSFREHTGGDHTEKKVVDWGKLHQMKKEKVPSWTMKLLVDVISNSGLSTMSGLLNQDVVEGGVALDDDEITCEEEAIATAVRIFYNVLGDKDQLYIDRNDLLQFMISEEVNLVYPLFEVNQKGKVDIRAFSKWVVRVYKDRQALKHALNDNKTAVDEFNKLLNGILIVIILILWLLLTEIVTTKILLFFSSQLLVAVFVFGNTCRTIFEAIIFVFVMHPFDVGDRCIIDGTMMVVEEMNILTTVFLKFDNEKIYYPNAVLATKSIGNYYRSPDQGDCVEFAIDYATSPPKIAKLKEQIKNYLEQTPHFWHQEHNLVVKEIEDINKIKMALYFTHTMNFQDFPLKSRRRSELILEMKNIFDDLEISYHLLPQEIHLTKTVSNV
ncbi:Mechanosensitive ion channel protein 10 [Bienertia sinuspersici]